MKIIERKEKITSLSDEVFISEMPKIIRDINYIRLKFYMQPALKSNLFWDSQKSEWNIEQIKKTAYRYLKTDERILKAINTIYI